MPSTGRGTGDPVNVLRHCDRRGRCPAVILETLEEIHGI
jgi:hypothetical protein